MGGLCHTALNPKMLRHFEKLNWYLYIDISLLMLGQLLRSTALRVFPGKLNSPELFQWKYGVFAHPLGIVHRKWNGTFPCLAREASGWWATRMGTGGGWTLYREAISVLLSSTGQAVGCHSPFSCGSSRATTSGRKMLPYHGGIVGVALHLLWKNSIFMKTLEIQSLMDREWDFQMFETAYFLDYTSLLVLT